MNQLLKIQTRILSPTYLRTHSLSLAISLTYSLHSLTHSLTDSAARRPLRATLADGPAVRPPPRQLVSEVELQISIFDSLLPPQQSIMTTTALASPDPSDASRPV